MQNMNLKLRFDGRKYDDDAFGSKLSRVCCGWSWTTRAEADNTQAECQVRQGGPVLPSLPVCCLSTFVPWRIEAAHMTFTSQLPNKGYDRLSCAPCLIRNDLSFSPPTSTLTRPKYTTNVTLKPPSPSHPTSPSSPPPPSSLPPYQGTPSPANNSPYPSPPSPDPLSIPPDPHSPPNPSYSSPPY